MEVERESIDWVSISTIQYHDHKFLTHLNSSVPLGFVSV